MTGLLNPFLQRNQNWITRLFSQGCPNVLSHSDDVAGHSHSDQAFFIRYTIKSRAHFDLPFAEFFSNVKRNFHIGPIHIRYLFLYCFKCIFFGFIKSLLRGLYPYFTTKKAGIYNNPNHPKTNDPYYGYKRLKQDQFPYKGWSPKYLHS